MTAGSVVYLRKPQGFVTVRRMPSFDMGYPYVTDGSPRCLLLLMSQDVAQICHFSAGGAEVMAGRQFPVSKCMMLDAMAGLWLVRLRLGVASNVTVAAAYCSFSVAANRQIEVTCTLKAVLAIKDLL